MESTEADREKAMRNALLGGENYRHEMEGLHRRRGAELVNIFVSPLAGDEMVLQVDLFDTIATVKAMIENEMGRPFLRAYLVFGGKMLQDDDRTLISYGVQKNSSLSLEYRLRGGDPRQGIKFVVVSTLQKLWFAISSLDQGLRGAGTPAQQQNRYSNYSRKIILFVMALGAANKFSASASLSIGKIAFMITVAAICIADMIFSAKKVLAPKWSVYLSVPWSIYLSGILLVFGSYLLLISFNKDYAYAIIFPVVFPIFAALVHHKCKSRVTQQRTSEEPADQAVDTQMANEDVLRGDDENNDETSEDHNSDDEDVQHFDGIFETSCNIVTAGNFFTLVWGHRMVGPVSPLGFFSFFTVVLGIYLMTITTVRTVALTPQATYLEILLKLLLCVTIITAFFHSSGNDSHTNDVPN